MTLMFLGFLGLAAAVAAGYLLQRRQSVLRLRAQVLQARLVLEQTLRQRRDLVEVWCTLCEERGLLGPQTLAIRKQLARIAALPVAARRVPGLSDGPVAARRVPGSSNRPAGADKKSGDASFSEPRWQGEKTLSRLIRESYAAFLEKMTDEGPQRDFFQQYFRSLTRLDAEMGDAHDLYNDSIAAYNRALGGWTGWYFRRWESLRPQAGLPSSREERLLRWEPGEGAAALPRPADPDVPAPAASRAARS